MISRIISNGWYLLFMLVQDVLSVLFPVREFPKPVPAGYEKYVVVNQCDPYRELGYYDHAVISHAKEKEQCSISMRSRRSNVWSVVNWHSVVAA